MAREAKLTDKDMSVLREADSARVQHKKPRGILKDYSMKHAVEMQWDLNEESKRDRMFRLIVGENEVILDWEEMLRYGRWI